MSIEQEIERLRKNVSDNQAELEGLLAQQEDISKGSPQAIANYLHKTRCHHNHTDMCGWEYETWAGTTPAGNSEHNRWLAKAQSLISSAEGLGVSVNALIQAIEDAKL